MIPEAVRALERDLRGIFGSRLQSLAIYGARAAAHEGHHAHDAHGVAMASLALSLGAASAKDGEPPLVVSRRVDFHLRGNSFSRWKHRQVDCFIAASDAIRQMLIADGVPAARTVTLHEGIDLYRVAAAPPVTLAGLIPSDIGVSGDCARATAGQTARRHAASLK